MTSTELVDEGSHALVESLARRVEAATPPEPYPLDTTSNVVVRVLRSDEQLHATNFEGWLPDPVRPRGNATLHDPSSFVDYVRRLGDGYTTVWGTEKDARFTAVLNDHADNENAGWRDHTAVLQLQDDPDWLAFARHDGKYLTQVQFAEFLQDYATVFIQPDGASLLEVALEFKAHKKAEYSSAINLDTGDVQLSYSEETKAKTPKAGQIDVPREFVVAIAPFLGMPPVQVAARLRWSLDDGQLSIGFKLHRPDLVKRDAFAELCTVIRDGLKDTPRGGDMPVHLGTPPQPVRPHN
ncbi:DUF2303 family protein [Amycolatopsis sp. YIM 10]|uniref:DUF2303 family protein n=1 Tax=Amycolatopsis sp. YIM 10 TaxID=2653857 RepID=UPI00128FFEA3|nr:DUF2303 family protein [Amycolatopsis sp. YIM 10]QFU87853.1 hypothetical protein YIM_13335 [Amycolatopsis sp. YIM 10]QFU94834.1 hypothetical protein YIM_48545 [Amycolatopsis sp. YIM 10]